MTNPSRCTALRRPPGGGQEETASKAPNSLDCVPGSRPTHRHASRPPRRRPLPPGTRFEIAWALEGDAPEPEPLEGPPVLNLDRLVADEVVSSLLRHQPEGVE